MSELKKHIYDEENGLHFTLIGDYYIPDLKLSEEHWLIGKYGRMHREFKRSPPSQIEHIDTKRRIVDISFRSEQTGTGTVRHHYGTDESCRGCDRGIEAYPSNGMGAALQ